MTSSHATRPYAHQRARQMLALRGLSQNADHLAHNSPFLACFAEVVCDLGTTSLVLDHHAGENGDTRTLTRQKNAPHAANPLRCSYGSTVNTTTRTQRSPNTFCPSSLLVAHAAHVLLRGHKKDPQGLHRLHRSSPDEHEDGLNRSDATRPRPRRKYEVGAELWAAREPLRAQRGVILPGSAYPGKAPLLACRSGGGPAL